jgi:bacterioferritin (cytochrome b1)
LYSYLLQTIIRFELNTSLLGKERTESSEEDLIMSKEARKEVKTLLQSVAAIMDFTQRGSFATFMEDVLCPL